MTGIVIITWNSEDVIGRCLDACLRVADVEIVVVDNGSSDRTIDKVKQRQGVRLIQNTDNRGFAGGANQGIQALRHPAVLLLNPDAVPLEGVAELAAKAVQPGIGAVAGKLIAKTGSPQSGFNVRAFPTPGVLAAEVLGLNALVAFNRFNRRYRVALDDTRETEVDQPAGAFLMLNRAAWQDIGGFDEQFHPVWFEDVDYCRRLRNRGYRILYSPNAVAEHIGGHSASRLSWHERQVFWYGSLLRYASKHFSNAGRRRVSMAVMIACVPRTLLGILSRKGLVTACVYSKVFWGAWAALRRTHPSDCVAASSSREENRARQFYS